MENWAEIVIAAVLVGAGALIAAKVWPILKEWLIRNKAQWVVELMEETFGGKTGAIKFEKGVSVLRDWTQKMGWKVDLGKIIDYVTAAVGWLHAKQGVVPTEPNDVAIAETLAEAVADAGADALGSTEGDPQ